MSQHTITEKDLTEWLAEQWFLYASSFGSDSNKSFEVNATSGKCRVTERGVKIYEGGSKATAIRKYNAAP
jgi:hypothetical protein